MSGLVQRVDHLRDDIEMLCRDLVRINTANPYSGDAAPGGEKAGQEYLAPILAELGARITLLECPSDIYTRTGVLGPRERDFSGRPNLIATWDLGGGGPTIVINGHMDTVGLDTMPNALAAEVREACIHGRGTSDCKGGLTVAVSALKALLAQPLELRGRIVLQSVVDEECNGSGAGTLTCLDAGYTGDIAVFVDGANGALTMGCGGCLTADLLVSGEEGHAAAGTGVSAIEKALVAKRGIDAFKARREAHRAESRVNLGIFRSGVHPAVVPGQAYLSLNAVYAYEEAEANRQAGRGYGGASIRAEFEELVRAAEIEDDWLREHPSRLEWVKDLIPYDQRSEDPWVQAFERAYRSALGQAPAYDKMTAWSDAAHSAALFRIPTVLYGPGVGNAAHTAHEYVPVQNLVDCTKVLATFLAEALTGS